MFYPRPIQAPVASRILPKPREFHSQVRDTSFLIYCSLLIRVEKKINWLIDEKRDLCNNFYDENFIFLQSEFARYSINLKKSITWSVCGNGQKEKHEGKQDER